MELCKDKEPVCIECDELKGKRVHLDVFCDTLVEQFKTNFAVLFM